MCYSDNFGSYKCSLLHYGIQSCCINPLNATRTSFITTSCISNIATVSCNTLHLPPNRRFALGNGRTQQMTAIAGARLMIIISNGYAIDQTLSWRLHVNLCKILFLFPSSFLCSYVSSRLYLRSPVTSDRFKHDIFIFSRYEVVIRPK